MNLMQKLAAAIVAIVAGGTAFAQCTPATINSGMPPRVVGLAQDGISALLGCLPTVLEPTPGVPQAPQIYTWGLVDGPLRKQIAVQFDRAGSAVSARYQEIPLLPGRSAAREDNSDTQAAVAIALMAAASGAARSAASGGAAICTPATINPGAVQMVRPHMSPAAVSGVLGCAPTEVGPVWVWSVPGADQAGAKIQVAVVFDAAGAVSAQYQVIPPIAPLGNGALRVEPPLPPFGNWVPGAAVR